jgi:hypothetical protein
MPELPLPVADIVELALSVAALITAIAVWLQTNTNLDGKPTFMEIARMAEAFPALGKEAEKIKDNL